ncbi:histidine phosphatase family protein [Paenibacillus phoenicis]|uniref:Histidine phosphatase family protein n=1 Tax=Paenibacillus phoenicis TaxID=554117 RepID=A0ABU5PLS6_9BACL|nr:MULTISPECIES: histidine phosphatase family protein [Paenibacillus]EES72912.1 phosphoglycerate mutase family protein [Paenibacillus sp. oral taxon 786 str. D14]MEA3570896.1 histidine phosphatase family protein [Paenibacillus phoenicis]
MTTYYLVRHGEPLWEINEIYKLRGHGRDLVPLTEGGIKQVHSASRDPRLKKGNIIISSPYTRAMQTAAILSKELKLELRVEFDLREWQRDLTFQYDSLEQLRELSIDYDNHKGIYPAGETRKWESKQMMKDRMDKVIDKYKTYDYVIVVGHGMAFRTQYEIEEIPHASIIEITKN